MRRHAVCMQARTRQACNALTAPALASHGNPNILADAVHPMARKLRSQHHISCLAACAIAAIACYFCLYTDLDFKPL